MNSHKKSRSLSRIILLFTATTMLINTTCITQASEPEKKSWVRRAWSVAKEKFSRPVVEKLKGLAGKAKDQIHSSLSATYQKIKGFDKTVIIDQLSKHVTKLGTQIGEIKDCMLFGQGCSSAKRAAFYATAITVLALTAAAVGFTITVAATSKEPDMELESAVSATSQEVKGWSAEAVFQRLNNKISSFKGNLLSMKQCLTKRQCTKTQKRTLYATAATIVALITITIGIGVGSYIYAERKRRKETEAKVHEPQENLKPFFEIPPLQDTPTTTQEMATLSPYQRFFRSKIDIIKGSAQTLQSAYRQAEQSMMETYSQIRDKIQQGIPIQKAQIQELVANAQRKASDTFMSIVQKGENFAKILQETLGIQVEKLKTGFHEAKDQIDQLKQNIQQVRLLRFGMGTFKNQLDNLLGYIKKLVATIKLIMPVIPEGETNLWVIQKLATIKGQSMNYLQQVLETREKDLVADRGTKKLVQEAENNIKIKLFLKDLSPIYQTLVQKINALEFYRVGDFAKTVLQGLASLIGSVQTIHKKAGRIGFIVSSNAIQTGMVNLRTAISGLGTHIHDALQHKPLITAESKGTIELALSLLHTAIIESFPKKATLSIEWPFGFLRENTGEIISIKQDMEKLSAMLEPIVTLIDAFNKHTSELITQTKEQFLATIQKNPMRNMPKAAQILRDSLAKAVRVTKLTFAQLLTMNINLLVMLSKIAPLSFNIVRALNMYFEKASGKPFINKELIDALVPILTIDLPNLSEAAKTLRSSVEATPAA